VFCDRCGAQVQSTDTICRACGKALSAVAQPAAIQSSPVPQGRVAQHVQLLGGLWIVVSILILVGGIVLVTIANTLFARGGMHASEAPPFLQPLLSVVGVLVLAKGALGFVAGLGLMQRQPWARLLALILAFVALLSVPFGTALGIYTMWVLLSHDAEQQYRMLAQA
jgi:hypothetical protein